MKRLLLALSVGVTLAAVPAAFGQGQVELGTTTPPTPRFEIEPQSPVDREATRPREADFYRDDVRVRHQPAFIEPLVGRTKDGDEYGLSGWTAPATPVGSLASQGYQQNTGWFSLGFTFVFDYPPKAVPRRTTPPR